MTEKELLPCPFCGEPPSLRTGQWGDTIYAYDCQTFWCQANHWRDHGLNMHRTVEEAREAWNRRAS